MEAGSSLPGLTGLQPPPLPRLASPPDSQKKKILVDQVSRLQGRNVKNLNFPLSSKKTASTKVRMSLEVNPDTSRTNRRNLPVN